MIRNFYKCQFLLITILFSQFACSQEKSIVPVVPEIMEQYEDFKEQGLNQRRINRSDIAPLLQNFRNIPGVEVNKVGTSIEGRDLSLVSIGTGETSVFLWSQMHGDESTATMAIFDILNFLTDASFKAEKEKLLQNVRLHFLPMLNPDGAEDFQRRNALGIDVNRDALRLQSPEGKTLKKVRDSLDPDFGFNLHDQSKYYNATGTPAQATISFLAPAYDFEKSINDVRGNAMKVIVEMNKALQKEAPGHVARYNDDFEPRAFGDNIQKWGTSTILIESGGFPLDPEKQEIRRLNVLAILTALFSISDKDYQAADINEYEKIPENDSKLFDLKLTGLEYELLGKNYILDLGINHNEVPIKEGEFYYHSRIADQGDLSTNYGYKNLDVSGFKMVPGKVYPEILPDIKALENLNFQSLLSQGIAFVRVKNVPGNVKFTNYPIQVVSEKFKPTKELQPGVNPTFFLEKAGEPSFAVINGFIVPLGKSEPQIENGLILKGQ